MNDKSIEFILRLTIVISILLIVFSFITPLANLTMEDSSQKINFVDYYSWGFKINVFSSQMPDNISTIIPYFSLAFDDTYESLVGGEGNELFIIFLTILLPIVIFSLILSIDGLYDVLKKDNVEYEFKLFLSGVFSVIVVLLFYLFIEFGMPNSIVQQGSITSSSVTSIYFNFELGSYLLIISAILLFILFAFSKYYYPDDKTYEESGSIEELITTLKRRYVSGEITEREFEKMKKKLEE
ncbi:MAG: SHOCT domain-containing protein [Candidatus Tenebribacter burtonii]|nr:SHOCT domain-containing protein [Candidatus Tenebribacter burtonii]